MNEAHFAEIEKTLLYISEARIRAERAAKLIAKDGADAHLVEALREAECELERGRPGADAADLLRRSERTADDLLTWR